MSEDLRQTLQSGSLVLDLETRRVVLAGREKVLSTRAGQILRILAEHSGSAVTRAVLLEALEPLGIGPVGLDSGIRELQEVLGQDRHSPRLIASVDGSGFRLVIPSEPSRGRANEPAQVSPSFDVLAFEGCRMQLAEHRLLRQGEEVSLRPKVFESLAYLAQNAGHLVTKDEIMDAVWPDVVVSESAVAHCIQEVREALCDDALHPHFVETVRGVGYRFLPEVQTLENERPDHCEPGHANREDANKRSQSGTGTEGWVHQPWVLAVVLLGLVASSLLWWFGGFVESGRDHTLAVLPLENLIGEDSEDYRVNGLTVQLTSALARVPGFSVRSHRSTAWYTGRAASMPEIVGELKVRYLVDGSVSRQGPDRYVLNLHLTDGQSATLVWADRFVGDFGQMPDRIAEAARAVTQQVGVDWPRNPETSKKTDPEALALYERGRYHLLSGLGEEFSAWEKARNCFQRAVELDPQFALAHSGLGSCYVFRSRSGGDDRDSLRQARCVALASLQGAIALDPSIPEAHAYLGELYFVFDWDWESAEKHFRKAIALGPSYPDAHLLYGEFLVLRGRFDEAIVLLERAAELDPLTPFVQCAVGRAYFLAGQTEKALARMQGVSRDFPNHSLPYEILGSILAASGRKDEALRMCRRGRACFPRSAAASGVHSAEWVTRTVSLCETLDWCDPWVLAVSGRLEQARAFLAWAEEQRPRPLLEVAEVLTGLGETDRAFECLESAYQRRDPVLLQLAVSPRLKPLRQDPRFRDLLKRMNW